MSAPTQSMVGTCTLAPWEAWLWSDAAGSKELPISAAYLIVTRAGPTITELMAMLDTKADGVLFGNLDIDLEQPLRTGTEYTVMSTFRSVERRIGRRTGPFDLVRLVHTLSTVEGPAAEIGQTWIVPR